MLDGTRAATVTEVRDATEETPPGFSARAVNYGVRDSYGTSWTEGVFKDSLAGGLPPVLWGHDRNDPIGRVTGYREDSTGLDIDVELDDFEAVPRAKQAYAQLRSGTMKEFSFAFARGEDRADPVLKNTTQITRADVDEFSLVMKGAVPGTGNVVVRSAPIVDTRSAEELIRRFSTGEIDLATALAELDGHRDVEPQFEIRAIGTLGAGVADPAQVLADVDTALAGLATELDRDDLKAAVNYFEEASSRLWSLLSLLGRSPVTDWPESWRSRLAGETRADEGGELPAELVGPFADDEEMERAFGALSRRADAKKPYGDVTYADPGHQKDGKKRYPLDTKEHVKAAWSYINMPKNAKAYSSDQLSSIKGKIKAAAKRLGVEISDS